ncbi:MAG TPA: restriction endonuclease subunit S [Gemmatimonadales bacterium]|nr:restriction endonuclease subunit S [Gemmatimonadales bacterium]
MAGEWLERELADLIENFDGVRVPVKEADRHPGPYPYYGASGVVDHVDKYLLDGEYLLIAEDGENLRTRNTPVAFIARGRFWVNNHAHVVRGNCQADTRFLMYALSAADISGYLTGSTMPKLTQGNMNRIPLLTPPLPEQRAIAHILGTLDNKIELNRRMSETLEAMARALFKSWFVDFDPVRAKAEGRDSGLSEAVTDLFPTRFVDSELGEIPDGWEIKPIGDLAEVVGGSTPKTERAEYWEGGTHRWVTPKDLSGLSMPVLLDTERSITDAGLGQISSGLLPQGTVLLSSRAPIGYLAITEVPVAVNQGFIAMKPRRGVSNLFLLRWASEAHGEIVSHANGSTFLEISKTNFRPIRTIAPSGPVMKAFDLLSQPMYHKVVEHERESRTLVALRDALLPKLLTGELRVSEAEPFVRQPGHAPT